jgi:hypothetical protein
VMNHLASYPQHDVIIDSLKRRNVVSRLGNVVLVTTDVLLPNGSQVTVVVKGGASGDVSPCLMQERH